MTAPSWLLPSLAGLPGGQLRTVGEPDPEAAKKARWWKWAKSEKGRTYYATRLKDPVYREQANQRHRKWIASPSGKAWHERNRERRNHYMLMQYHTNPKRREYLMRKQREYRAAKKAAKQ